MKSDENKITKQITRQSESHVTVPQSKVNHTAKNSHSQRSCRLRKGRRRLYC